MENEIRLDSELNEEEVVRISATNKQKLEEKEDRYMRCVHRARRSQCLPSPLKNRETEQETEAHGEGDYMDRV